MYETYVEPEMEASGAQAMVDSHARPKVSAKRFGILGALVRDLTVEPLEAISGVSKTPCRIREEFGGAGRNAACAMRNYGGLPEVDLLVGGEFWGEASERLLDELPQSRLTPAFDSTRRSIHLPNGVSYTSRPPMSLRALPDHLRASIAAQDATLVAPASAADHAFIRDAVSAANFAVLQLSADQLGHEAGVRELVQLAAVTVLNHEEAGRLTGETDSMRAVMKLCEFGCRGAIVTDHRGAWARIDGQWSHASAFSVPVKKTVGAGDCFAAILIWAWMSGWETAEALTLGQAAAARHIAGLPGLGSLERLATWAADQPRARLAPAAVPQSMARVATAGAAATAATALSLLTAFS